MNPGLNSILSAKKAYVALSTAMRDVICFINLIQEIQDCGIKLLHASKPKVTCRVFEDNVSALELANTHKLRPMRTRIPSSILATCSLGLGADLGQFMHDSHHLC